MNNSDQPLCGRCLDWTSQWDFYSCRICLAFFSPHLPSQTFELLRETQKEAPSPISTPTIAEHLRASAFSLNESFLLVSTQQVGTAVFPNLVYFVSHRSVTS